MNNENELASPAGKASESYSVASGDQGKRIDKFLSEGLADVSRSHLQKMIERGDITVNGSPVRTNYKLREGDEIRILTDTAPVPVAIVPQDIPLSIIHEDDDLLIVDKPKGMVVHPAAGHPDGTLVNAVLFHCGERLSGINGELRPGIVHRIDKDTTGSLIVCKNDRAHQLIAEQIAVHSIRRSYVGIVHGNVKEESGTIDAPIGRDPKNRKRMAVNAAHGKRAVTHYHILKRLKGYTYLQFDLETGRTHQIRVHAASMGHPLLGDEVYGPKKCPFRLQGQTLHAWRIGFVHPATGEYVEYEAPVPEYMEELVGKLGADSEKGDEPKTMSEVLDRVEKRGETRGRKAERGEITKLMAFLAANGRNDDIVRAGSDENFLDKLLKDFNSGLMVAK